MIIVPMGMCTRRRGSFRDELSTMTEQQTGWDDLQRAVVTYGSLYLRPVEFYHGTRGLPQSHGTSGRPGWPNGVHGGF